MPSVFLSLRRSVAPSLCVSGQVKMVELLLAANADCNKLDKYGDAPLHWAAKRGHPPGLTLSPPRN
eukprot:347514-Rhodomonas_salina.2